MDLRKETKHLSTYLLNYIHVEILHTMLHCFTKQAFEKSPLTSKLHLILASSVTFLHCSFLHTSVLIHSVNYLTSNKHHCSSQFCLRVVVTDDVGSCSAGWSLINYCSSIASPTQSSCVYDRVA